jgi:hypothetical protein
MLNRYRFKGHAYAASGIITTPFREIIEVQAATNLADFGGFGSSRVSGFRHRDILRFEEAHSEVTGSRTHLDEPGETYSTLVRSTVEGVNILGMVTADKVVAHLVSTYRTGPGAENSVKLIGSRFENLRIGGIPVQAELSVGTLDKYHHHKDLKAAYAGDQKVRDLFGDDSLRARHPDAPKEVKNYLAAPPGEGPEMPADHEGTSTVSIVKKLHVDSDALECYGHVIHIDGFGTIRLGEVHICKKTRALTMIQIHLGCPYDGDTSLGSAADGGSGN